MHSQMGADLPLRAVLGIFCCPAPLNGTRNARLCALSWALLRGCQPCPAPPNGPKRAPTRHCALSWAFQGLPMLPSAPKLTTKSMPTWLYALSWAPLRASLCARRAPRRAVVAALRAAGVEMHSQMRANLPLRAVLGVSCCPAPLNGARNARLCALPWAQLGCQPCPAPPNGPKCAPTRHRALLWAFQGLSMAPCAAKLTTKSMPTWLRALSWDAKHARICLRAERAPLCAVLAALRAAGIEIHSQMGANLPLRAVLGVSCCPAPLNGARNNARLCAPSWALLGLPALSCTAERSKMRADPALRIVLGPALPN